MRPKAHLKLEGPGEDFDAFLSPKEEESSELGVHENMTFIFQETYAYIANSLFNTFKKKKKFLI